MDNRKTNLRDLTLSYLSEVIASVPDLDFSNHSSLDFSKCPDSKYSNFRNFGVPFPRHNIIEGNNSYTYTFDVPGVKKEDVTVTVTERNGVLTVKGARNQESTDEGSIYKITESRYGSFSRSYPLAEDAVADDISAKLENGVLSVSVKRVVSDENTNERKVTIS